MPEVGIRGAYRANYVEVDRANKELDELLIRHSGDTLTNIERMVVDHGRKYLGILTDVFVEGMFSEGIAIYIETNGKREDHFSTRDLPPTALDVRSPADRYHLMYRGGYHLVKPILDKFGKDGIDHLIANPFKSTDLRTLPDYQKQVMQDLSK